MKLLVTVLTIFVLFLGATSAILLFDKLQSSSEIELQNNFSISKVNLSNSSITCRFDYISTFGATNEFGSSPYRITAKGSFESDPIEITFANLSSNTPTITTKIGSVQVEVVTRNSEKILLAETNGIGNVFYYSIYLDEKVATWYKSYSIISVPFAMLSMGYCK